MSPTFIGLGDIKKFKVCFLPIPMLRLNSFWVPSSFFKAKSLTTYSTTISTSPCFRKNFKQILYKNLNRKFYLLCWMACWCLPSLFALQKRKTNLGFYIIGYWRWKIIFDLPPFWIMGKELLKSNKIQKMKWKQKSFYLILNFQSLKFLLHDTKRQ